MTIGSLAVEDRRLYRKQYVLGPRAIERPGWRAVRVAEDLWLTVHPDLGVVESRSEGLRLTLLGYVIDPYAPDASDQRILDGLASGCRTFAEVIRGTKALGGRWIIVCDDGSSVRVFSDPLASRQLYHAKVDGRLWCAAESALLAAQLGIPRDDDPLLQEYLHSAVYRVNQGYWPGDGSVHAGVHHLLPNHSLDLRRGVVSRFWPDEVLGRRTPGEAAPIACEILTGALRAIANRSPLMLTVTAGWDSRIVLAASRAVAPEVYYFVQRLQSSAYNAVDYDAEVDVRVPRQLLTRLGLDFHVIDSTAPPDRAFSEAFDANVARAREAGKPAFYALLPHENRIRVLGMFSEIARDKFYDPVRRRPVTPQLLARVSHAGNAFAEARLTEWLEDARQVDEGWGFGLYDLFQWEQKFGNWAALGSAEGDIVGEEFTPFNNRKLLTTMLSVDIRHRTAPGCRLHRRMMRLMWPETLSVPINPRPLTARAGDTVKTMVRRMLGTTPVWTYIRARKARRRLASVSASGPATARGGTAPSGMDPPTALG